jgi:hypothetical protein
MSHRPGTLPHCLKQWQARTNQCDSMSTITTNIRDKNAQKGALGRLGGHSLPVNGQGNLGNTRQEAPLPPPLRTRCVHPPDSTTNDPPTRDEEA